MKTRIAGMLAGSLLLASGTVMAVPVAHADLSQCPSGTVCLFANSNYVGLLGYRSGGGDQNVSSGANDQSSSWANKGSQWASWAHDINMQGKCINMVAGSTSNMAWNDNDNLSSWRVWGTCP